jgi:hypothetical protein
LDDPLDCALAENPKKRQKLTSELKCDDPFLSLTPLPLTPLIDNFWLNISD